MNTMERLAVTGLAEADPPEDDDAFEHRVQHEHDDQFRALQQRAKAIFATIKGRPGIRSEADFRRLMEKVTGDYEAGRFVLEQLGASRFIDYETTLTLSHIRAELLSNIERPTMADKLAAETAIIGYRNLLRLQAWIGDIALTVEREMFGQTPLDTLHGPEVGEQLAKELRRLEHQIFPLIDRAHKMLMRSLSFLEARVKGHCGSQCLSVGVAGQVNVGVVLGE